MHRVIDSIIVHCSDSDFGDRDIIDQWHRERGFDEIGYHFVITNGVLRSGMQYTPAHDGEIQTGRSVGKTGAHCKGHNSNSIGICLIGKHHFTAKQLCRSLPHLLGFLMRKYNVSPQAVYGHCQFNHHKTCPNIQPEVLRGIAALTAPDPDRRHQDARRV